SSPSGTERHLQSNTHRGGGDRVFPLAMAGGAPAQPIGEPCYRGPALMRSAPICLVALLSACAAPQAPPNARVPPFAQVPYAPITRDAVVALALREWRLFGSPVDDDTPGTYRPATPDDKPERQQGLWQRVGEYWWLGMDAGASEGAW